MGARFFGLALAMLSLSADGCAWDEGRGFARLQGSLWSRFAGLDPASGRVSPDGWFKTATSFELKLDRLLLGATGVRVLGGGQSSPSSSCHFDPAAPPEGCTLCHGGHCHCDGKLVSYEELQAKACGDGAAEAAEELARFPLSDSLPLLGEGSRVALRRCEPSCEVGAGQISKLQLRLGRLQLSARLRDASSQGRLGGAELSLQVDLDLGKAGLALDLAEPIVLGEEQPHVVDLGLSLPVTATLLDLEWHALERSDGSLTVNAVKNVSAGEALINSFSQSLLSAAVRREDE